MTSAPSSDFQALKQQIRKAAQARRALLSNREELSRQINARLLALREFETARSVAFYVAVRNEVGTRPALLAALAAGKLVSVPFCEEGGLQLVRIESEAELETGAYGIPEPSARIRELPKRKLSPEAVDLIVVPGVAFDRAGNRLGHGAGYYDRLLAQIPSSATLAALAFDCQIVEAIPAEPHDVRMHLVLTDTQSIRTGVAQRALG